MNLAEIVAATEAVGATTSRTAKRYALAAVVRNLGPDEVASAVGFLMGAPRQGRVGVGWSTVSAVSVHHAAVSSLTVTDLDHALDQLAGIAGPGSAAARSDLLARLLAAATPAEGDFVRRLLLGELRQGALEGVMADAVAQAAHLPAAAVRRAMMLSGDLRLTAEVAMAQGRDGLDRIGLTLLRPVQPMLAAAADDVNSALIDAIASQMAEGAEGAEAPGGLASVEWKLDGARIQIHRDGAEVAIFTRNLNDVTHRLPGVVDLTLALPAQKLVVDAEILSVRDDERPVAFQETMSTFGRDATRGDERSLYPFFFDVLHLEGQDLIDAPLADRLKALDEVARPHRIPRLITADPIAAQAFLDQALAAGHEGVMVKALDSAYQAGRRGKAWRKVKPVRLFDLVVIAAEWGHGRRQGWLSNLHLGAVDGGTAGFVMVGKTFKGLTDKLLTWQTTALLEREIGRDGITVHVKPELVVEIAMDGVQHSTRYPGGVALRFARVKRYRPDKSATDADTIESLQALLVR